jgi:hypothetical protein
VKTSLFVLFLLLAAAVVPAFAFDNSLCKLTGFFETNEGTCPQADLSEWVGVETFLVASQEAWSDNQGISQDVWVQFVCIGVGYVGIQVNAQASSVSLSAFFKDYYSQEEMLIWTGYAYYNDGDQSFGWPGNAIDNGKCVIMDSGYWSHPASRS